MQCVIWLVRCCVVAGLFLSHDAEGQVRAWPPVAQMLSAFESEMARSDGRGMVPAGITHTLTHADSFTPARVDSLLDGLQRLALASENDRVALMAVTVLASSADRNAARPPSGVAERLRIISRGAVDPGARRTALHRLPLQCDVAAAVRALETEATATPEGQSYPGSARDAVALLRDLGTRGEAALVRLHRSGLVKELEARNELDRQIRELRGSPTSF